MAVFEKVQEIIVEELGKEAEEVKLETTFDELDADSLDVFQVVSEIEDAFDIQIETEEGLNTVGDLVAYVEEKQIMTWLELGLKTNSTIYLVERAVG